MKYCAVLTMLLTTVFHVNEGRPDDCEYSDTAEMTNCQFYCGFSSSWITCYSNTCCCGGYDGYTWRAFRYYEGELCRDDKPKPSGVNDCDAKRCEASCKKEVPDRPVAYECIGTRCFCNLINDSKDYIGIPLYRNE